MYVRISCTMMEDLLYDTTGVSGHWELCWVRPQVYVSISRMFKEGHNAIISSKTMGRLGF